jgi:hypothetical protein
VCVIVNTKVPAYRLPIGELLILPYLETDRRHHDIMWREILKQLKIYIKVVKSTPR